MQAIRLASRDDPRADLGVLLKAPSPGEWLAAKGDNDAAFTSATIHSVKGREYASVVVVLPKKLIRESR